jgi:hypothetical protein
MRMLREFNKSENFRLARTQKTHSECLPMEKDTLWPKKKEIKSGKRLKLIFSIQYVTWSF